MSDGHPPVRYSWITRDAVERARTMSLHARFERVNRFVLVLVAVSLAPAVFVVDHPLAVFALATVGFAQYGAIQALAPARRRPEVWLFWSLLVAAACITAAVALSGLAQYGALGLLLWPASGLASRFPTRVVVVGMSIITVLLVAGFAFGAPEVLRDAPVVLSGFIAINAAVAINVSVLRLSDVAHHNAATFDVLTGLPNRVALRARADALEGRRYDAAGTALIVLDIDHFKRINDEFGHQAGDDVLTAFGALLRDEVRGDDLAYRLGGEEFAVLVPGLDTEGATDLAQRLLHATRRAHLAGHRLTASAGVAVTRAGEPLSWQRLFARADAALYRAKEDGRDRVRWDAVDVPAEVPA
ncbi:MAG: GGDEF domain-containing protein [Solirubrobacteraceae bacterium]|nr:GGDEF domain-containing protein [Solirubrobacteraceae bacterium]